ncbi:glycosyltransferase family 9 protein [Vaginella massiliensis]|uniref:glycosyltransferase family 9 protein n=1 Tax=Vaginella massiliensis TaxID=1816680 RepID=UPI0008384967|nr:glycosyltransferase family 9 protein [Vaginella massiliensis]
MKNKKRILVLRFSALGDVAMLAPVLDELKKQHSNEISIYVASRPGMKAIFNQIENIHFIPVDLDDEYKGLLGLYRLYRRLHKYHFSAVADCHHVLRSKILCKFFQFSGKKIAVLDKGRAEKKALVSQQNKVLKPLKHMTERYADVFRELGYTLNLSHQLYPSPNKIPKTIGIAPFAKFKSKTYDLKKMKSIAIKFAEAGYKVLLFGGGKIEAGILHKWEKKHANIKSLAGKMTFHEELVYIAKLEVIISMDSANMHLASLMGTRVISIWGGTHPYAGFLGYGQSMEDVIQDDGLTIRPTSIYGKDPKKFKNFDYFQHLEANDVFEKIRAKIEA